MLLAARLVLVVTIAGCAVAPRTPPVTGALDAAATQCAAILGRVDTAVASEGVGDGMAARIAGFPHLRVNRFLASYAREALDEARFSEWVQRMAALGTQSYAIELANLPSRQADQLTSELQALGSRHAALHLAVAECAKQLAAADLTSSERRALLREAAQVPDDYVDWQRVLGLYWLTRIPFAHGIQRWQEDVRRVYAQPLNSLPVTGEIRLYAAPRGRLSRAEVADVLARASNNALDIPEPDAGDLDALFATFAPDFEIDTAGAADRPGELVWQEGAAPRVDPARFIVYRRASHTRYREQVLLQLNYSIWFPERPRDAGWDLLGGHLDGLLWRVTLTPDGVPWLFDSIHLCGCYHQFFTTARALLKALPPTLDETAFVPQDLPRLEAESRLVLRVASSTHYLQRVLIRPDSAHAVPGYAFAEDDALRSLPLSTGERRSAFRADGVVPGTERGERYLFWPMGVPEPGAMRQWGRHATAFVGRRHFDDARLLEQYFEMTPR